MNYEDREEIAVGDRLVEAQEKLLAKTEKGFKPEGREPKGPRRPFTVFEYLKA